MNKKQRLQIKQAKEITYQEAWNKISEFMNVFPLFSFQVSHWSKMATSEEENKYTLFTYVNDEQLELFVADKEWVNK